MSKRIRTPATNPIFRYRDDCLYNDEDNAREMTDTFRNRMAPVTPPAAMAVSLERYNERKVAAILEKHVNRDYREFKFEG